MSERYPRVMRQVKIERCCYINRTFLDIQYYLYHFYTPFFASHHQHMRPELPAYLALGKNCKRRRLRALSQADHHFPLACLLACLRNHVTNHKSLAAYLQ